MVVISGCDHYHPDGSDRGDEAGGGGGEGPGVGGGGESPGVGREGAASPGRGRGDTKWWMDWQQPERPAHPDFSQFLIDNID